jgi:hypothetical protein
MIPLKLQLEIILFSLFVLGSIIQLVRKNRITIKYSLVWMSAILAILIGALIPGILPFIADLLGFETLPNLIFTLMIGILISVSMVLTIIVSGLKEKVRVLTQEISLLKERDR